MPPGSSRPAAAGKRMETRTGPASASLGAKQRKRNDSERNETMRNAQLTLGAGYDTTARRPGICRGWVVRSVLISLLTWLAGPTPAAAQTDNAPKIEVAAGPSLLRNGATAPSFSLYGGWQAEVSGNFNKHIGLTADFSGEYRSISGARISQYHYLFGPQFAVRRNRATGFAHALVGADTLRAAGNSTSGFALGVGGGLDVNVGRRIAIRIVQADYLPTRVSNLWFRDFRLGMGIVFKFGGS